MGHWTSSSAGPSSVNLDHEGSRHQPIALDSDDETESVQITRANKPAVQVLSDSDEEMVQIDLCSDDDEMVEADQKPPPSQLDAAVENKSEDAEGLPHLSPNKKDPESEHANDDHTESESCPMQMESFEPDNVEDDAGEPIADTNTDYQDETNDPGEPEQPNNSSSTKLQSTGSFAVPPNPNRDAVQAGSPEQNIAVAKPPSLRASSVDSVLLIPSDAHHSSHRSAAASETKASPARSAPLAGASTKPISSEMHEHGDLSSGPEHEPASVSDDDVAQSRQSPKSVDGQDQIKSDQSGRESPITVRRSFLERQPDRTALSRWAMVSEDDEDSGEDESVPIDEADPSLSKSAESAPAGPSNEAEGSNASSSEEGQQAPESVNTSRSKRPLFRACDLPELPNFGAAAHESADTDTRRLTLTGMLSGLKAAHLAHTDNESLSDRGSLRTAAAGGDIAVQNSTPRPTETNSGEDADMQMSDRIQISQALPVIGDRAAHSTRLDASNSSIRNRSASASSASQADESCEDVLMLKSDSAASPSLSSSLPSGMPDTESASDNFDSMHVDDEPRRARSRRSPKQKTGETSVEGDSTSPDRDNDDDDIWTWRQDAHLREAFRPIDDDSIFCGFLSKMDPIVLRDLALSHIEGKTLQQALARARKLQLL